MLRALLVLQLAIKTQEEESKPPQPKDPLDAKKPTSKADEYPEDEEPKERGRLQDVENGAEVKADKEMGQLTQKRRSRERRRTMLRRRRSSGWGRKGSVKTL